MQESPKRYRVKVFGVVLLALLQGCGGAVESTVLPTGTRRLIWLDLSSSITPQQRTAWQGEADKVLAQLAPGDSVAIYGVHEATGDAAPFFQGEMPVVAPDASLSEKLEAHKQHLAVRRKAHDAIMQALTSQDKAPRTDLFAVLDRVKPDPQGRPTVLYVFSDMLHVTAELNMEKTPLEKTIPELVPQIVTRHGWSAEHLAHTAVYCILPGSRGNTAVNSRYVVERFWDTLLRELGGELKAFETNLPGSTGKPQDHTDALRIMVGGR